MPKDSSLKKLISFFSRRQNPIHPSGETFPEQQLDEPLLLREFLKNTKEGVRIIDTKGFIVVVNRAYCRLTGYTRDELLKMNIRDIDFPDYPEEVNRRIEAVMKKGAELSEMRQRRKDGSFFDAEVSSTFLDVSGGFLVSICRDVTVTKETETGRDLIVELLMKGNQTGDERRFMTDAVELLKKWSGCEAAGIRVMDGDDYPYYVTTGFPSEFVEAANHLCAKDGTGLPVKDSNGLPMLQCMCADVIYGRTDSAQPFFTAGGSFWTNSVTALLAGATRQQLAALADGNCHARRYESLALIPLKWSDVNLGLIQLSDRRPGRFSPSAITNLEHAAIIVAAGLVSRGASEELRRSEEKYRLIVETSLEGILVTDYEFRLTYVNDAFAKILGYSPDELVGNDVQHFFYDRPGPEGDVHLQYRRDGRDEVHQRRFRHKRLCRNYQRVVLFDDRTSEKVKRQEKHFCVSLWI